MQTRKRSLAQIAARLRHIELFDARGLDDALKRNLYWVIGGILFGQITAFITTGAVWTGFLRDVLKADDLMIGLITAVPVAANTVQLICAHLMQRYQKRRFFMLFFGMLGRFFWVPIAFIPYLLPAGAQGARMMMVAMFVVAVAVGNSFVNVAFASLMADMVPMRIRGKYFSARHAASMVTGLIGAFMASFLIDRMGAPGYTLVLAVAGVAGVLDIACFLFVDFPPMDAQEGAAPPRFFASLKEVLRDKNFMLVVMCFTCWAFAVGITAPFYNVFMLQSMRMNYTEITLLNQITSNVFTLLFVARWGAPMDRFGNKSVLQITARVCMLTPLPWLFARPGSLWLIFVANALSGIFYAPIDLTQQNLYFGASSSKNRAMYVAVFFASTNLIGIALSNALGGLLLQTAYVSLAQTSVSLWLGLDKYQWMFLTSSMLRIAVVFGLFPRLKEQGSTHYWLATRTILSETWQGWRRFAHGVRATRLRRRYRAQMAQQEPPAHEQSDTPPD